MSKWNYRVFRCIDHGNLPYYEMRETHYDDAGNVNGWTEGASAPMGETFQELIGDLAWLMAALNKPILSDDTGLECEPAQMLADDIQKWMDAKAEAGAKGEEAAVEFKNDPLPSIREAFSIRESDT